jgi:hypothetical protein
MSKPAESPEGMKRTRRATTLTVFVLAIAGHALLIAMLALERPQVGFRIGPGLPPVRVSLMPPTPPAAASKPPSRRPPPPPSVPTLPIPVPPAPVAPQASAPVELPNLARPVFRVWPRPLPGGTDWGGTGCDDPVRHLSPEQREHCLKRWGSPNQQIAEIPAMIARDKQAAFDRRIWCRDKYNDAPVPIGTDASQNTMFPGLGYNPSLKDCPPGDR